jgi:hypothetical protein
MDEYSEEQKLTGVGGWLVFIIIGLIISILWNFYDLTALFDGSLNGIDLLASYGVDTLSFYIAIFIEVIWVVMEIVFLILIFTRSANTRGYAFFFYGGMIATTLVYVVAFSAFESSINEMAGYAVISESQTLAQNLSRGIGWSIVWMIYWARSKRVKHTFSKATSTPQPVAYSSFVSTETHELLTPETTPVRVADNTVGSKSKNSGVSYKALFIGVSSVFALVLVLAVATLYTAKTWTKIDVPEHKETYHDETYSTGNYIITMDDSSLCWINQGWADCINLHVNEYNRECANRRLTSSSSSLCERYSNMIDDMKAKDGGYGWHVTSLGSWGSLHSTQETATRKVSNNDYRVAVTHEATCYWGKFGECPDD